MNTVQKRIVLVSFIILITGLCLFFFKGKNSRIENIFFKNTRLVVKHGYSQIPGTDHIILATNRNLVDYDLFSGESKLLLKDSQLPVISKIILSSDVSRAIVQAQNTSPSDSLGSLLVSGGRTTGGTSWWVVNFKESTFAPINGEISNAGWVDNTHMFVVGKPTYSDFGVFSKNINDQEYKKLLLDKSVLNAYFSGGRFYAYFAGGGIYSIKDGSKKLVGDNLLQAPQLSPNGEYFAGLMSSKSIDTATPEMDSGDLVLIQLSSFKKHVVGSRQTGLGAWSSDSSYLYHDIASKQFVSVSPAGNKNPKIQYKPKDLGGSVLTNIIYLGDGRLLAQNSDLSMVFGSTKADSSIKLHSMSPTISSEGLKGDGFSIYYNETSKSYSLFVNKVPYDTYKERALSALRESGADTNLIDLTYDAESLSDSPATDQDLKPEDMSGMTNGMGGL